MKTPRPFETDQLPWSLRAAAQIVFCRRPGLSDPARMPRIERCLTAVTLVPEWLRQYCDCVGVSAEALQARGVPPLALQIAAGPLHLAIIADPVFPFRALGLVHLTQSVRQHRTIDPAARLDLLAYTTDARTEKRGISFGLVTEAREQGELVWRSEIRALSIQRARDPADRSEASTDDEYASFNCTGEARIAVPEHTGRHYARIAGDRNPIHQHALLARPFGFRRAIVHGTWTLARALASAGLPQSPAYELHARFRRPVELPSSITVCSYQGGEQGQRAVSVVNAESGKVHIAIDVLEAAS